MATAQARDWPKWGFFAVLAIGIAYSAWLDDRFVLNPADPEWGRLAQWFLLAPHALCGVAALLIGPMQFSSRLRRARPALHRWSGRIYVGACLLAGPTAAIVAIQHHAVSNAVPQSLQGGLWVLCTVLALVYALRRDLIPHRLWMMRSYGFCLVFVLARLPDVDPKFDWTGTPGVTVLWSCIIIALLGPDLILAGPGLLKPTGTRS
jgi:Predicted membrane protein (DUF2306)